MQAIAGTYSDASTRKGWAVPHLVPLLVAIQEELPWILQWHNEVEPEFGVRLGDFFREQLSRDLHTHGLTREESRELAPASRRTGSPSESTSMTKTLSEVFEIPEAVHQGDFVLRLTEGLKADNRKATLQLYVVTPQLVKCGSSPDFVDTVFAQTAIDSYCTGDR